MIRFALKAFINLWILLLVISCGKSEKPPDGHEVIRKIAPDSLGQALVWIPDLDGLGATMSQPYQVWLQSLHIGNRNALIFEADKTDGVRLTWKNSRQLEICYSQARIVYFQNFFIAAEQDSPGIYEVEIILKKVSTLSDC